MHAQPEGGDDMRPSSVRLSAVVATAAALLLTSACANPGAPGAGGGEGDTSEPLAELELTAPGGRKATLTCTPDGGSHPDPEAACDALRAAGGDFDRLVWKQDTDRACIDLYDPVWTQAKGSWQSSPDGPTHRIDWSREFSNSCYASLYHNVVFAL